MGGLSLKEPWSGDFCGILNSEGRWLRGRGWWYYVEGGVVVVKKTVQLHWRQVEKALAI
jgi:hypothetical protein